MELGTKTERSEIRAAIYSGKATINVHENADCTWFADFGPTVIECDSAARLFREIVTILEEV